jgi:IS30 family transposase
MSYGHLTMDERNVIWRMKLLGHTQAETAKCLGRDPGTISRERRRNAESDGRYFPGSAQVFANARRAAQLRRPRTGDAALMAHVEAKLQERWSPEQIAGRLGVRPPRALAGKRISPATIYRWIWSCPERSRRLRVYLRVAHRKRRKPYGKPSRRGQIPNRVSIDQRPRVVEGRTRLGDWEGDTIVGQGRRGYVVTNVDRTSRYLVARKVEKATAASVTAALHEAMRRLPADRRRTQTFDNGREFAGHEDIARRLGVAVYFAHPYSSWERGTNENTNGLLRQYLPKGSDFAQLTTWQLESTIRQLNDRPRKCLNYRTPAEVFWRRSVALAM